MHVRTRVVTVNLSGDTAKVLCSLSATADRKLDDGEGDTASLFGRLTRIKVLDTWVHLPEGWYLARTQEIASNYTFDVKGHVDQ